jgi:hypothetical protein
LKSRFAPDHQDTSDGSFNPAWDDPNFLNELPPASDNGVSRAPLADPILPTPALSNEAIQAESAQTGSTSTVVVTSGGITFDLIFDAAATAAPASFQAGIEQAASILAATIANKITVNIEIDYSGTGGGAAAGPDNGQYVSYSTVKADLIKNAAPGDTTFNSLPAGSTIGGQSQVAVWNAQLKLFGLLPANSTTTDDGSATFATDINPNLLVGVALHELTHALGRIPYGSEPDIFDFDRFTSAGTRLFTDNIPATAAYFSLDGGVTKIADYGQNSDPSDFLNPPGSNLTPNDAFNEFYNNNTLQQLTAVDLKQLDALGFYIGTPVNHPPVVTVPSANVTATAGQVFAVSTLFTATDADNDVLTYFLYDGTANGGHFVVNGTVEPSQTVVALSAAQVAQSTFVAGPAGTSDALAVMAYDGQAYSGNTSFSHFDVSVPSIEQPPVVTIPSANVSASAGQVFAASSLFSVSDPSGGPLTYFLYDGTANGGHFVVNGVVEPAQTVVALSAAQLAQTTFVAGAAGSSDALAVMAYDGQAYSGNTSFSQFHVNVGAATDQAPVVTIPSANVSASAGQVIAASSLFSVSDPSGGPLTYFLYDGTVNGGHFVVNGMVEPAQTVIALSAAQLTQTTFVAGAAGGSDALAVMAYDGQAYSGNTSFSQFHVNVSSPIGSASPNTNATGGDQFVFARGLGQNVSSEFFQSVSAPPADHFSQIFGAGGAAPIDGNGTFGSHADAAVDPLALFGLHAAPHIIADHFGV